MDSTGSAKTLEGETLSREQLLEMYKKMVLIRVFEYKIKDLFTSGEIGGAPHLSVGEEAVAVGVCANLRKNDYVTSTHRAHGHCIAKGADVNRAMAEFFGKSAGLCLGRGGSMHLSDFSVGIISTPIVGGGLPLAVGYGLSAKMRRTDQVAVAFFGDGAAQQGTFHESLNLAAIWKLPIIFVCENNQYAESMKIDEASPVKIFEKACAYRMPGVQVDGMDVLAVYQATRDAVNRARSGGGPSLIDAETYRFEGHEMGDLYHIYQQKEEMERWKRRDPIATFGRKLLEMGLLTEEGIKSIGEGVKQVIDNATTFAKQAPEPEVKDAFRYVFVSEYY